MKNFRSFFIFFVVLFVSSSIVFDWNDSSFNTSGRNVERNLFTDKFEDHNLQMTHITIRNAIFSVKKRRIWIDSHFEKFTRHTRILKFSFGQPVLVVQSALKSYLHLLHLY